MSTSPLDTEEVRVKDSSGNSKGLVLRVNLMGSSPEGNLGAEAIERDLNRLFDDYTIVTEKVSDEGSPDDENPHLHVFASKGLERPYYLIMTGDHERVVAVRRHGTGSDLENSPSDIHFKRFTMREAPGNSRIILASQDVDYKIHF